MPAGPARRAQAHGRQRPQTAERLSRKWRCTTGGQIRADAAASLELAKDLVVVVDDFEVDGGLKLLDRIRREPVAAAYELDDLIDDGEMFEELAFDGHRGMAEIITP